MRTPSDGDSTSLVMAAACRLYLRLGHPVSAPVHLWCHFPLWCHQLCVNITAWGFACSNQTTLSAFESITHGPIKSAPGTHSEVAKMWVSNESFWTIFDQTWDSPKCYRERISPWGQGTKKHTQKQKRWKTIHYMNKNLVQKPRKRQRT